MVSPSFCGCVVFVGYSAPSGPWPVSTSRLQVEAARRRRQGREAVIPAAAIDLRAERVDPQRKRRLDLRGVLPELVGES